MLNNGTGLITIIKNNIMQYKKTFKEIIPGRATCLELENKEYKYNIVNIYGPATNTEEKVPFCDTLFEIVKNIKNCILIGDWNILLNENMCNLGLNANHKQTSNEVNHHFSHWIEVHNLTNTDLKYTYSRENTVYKARLDRIYMKIGTTTNIRL